MTAQSHICFATIAMKAVATKAVGLPAVTSGPRFPRHFQTFSFQQFQTVVRKKQAKVVHCSSTPSIFTTMSNHHEPLQSHRAHLDLRLTTLDTLTNDLSRSVDRGFGWHQEQIKKQTQGLKRTDCWGGRVDFSAKSLLKRWGCQSNSIVVHVTQPLICSENLTGHVVN
jgi:hypothetical protein